MKNIKREVIVYLIIDLIISIIPFLNLSIFAHTNFVNPFNGFQYQSISEYINTWHNGNLGEFTVLFMPYLLFVLFLYKVFFDFIANIIAIGFIKFLAGIFIYKLVGKFTKNTTLRIVSSLFYLLSIYGQAMTENSISGGYLFYAFLPLYMYIFLTISNKNIVKYLFFYTVPLLFVIDTNFTYIAYLYLLFFIYTIYTWIVNKDGSRFKFFFLFLGVFIFLSQVYYLPLVAYNYIYKAHLVSTSLNAESVAWKSEGSSLSEVIRLMGSLDFYDAGKINNTVVFSHPFFQYFIVNPLIIFISFLFSITALAGFIVTAIKDKLEKKKSIFFLLAFVIFAFFSVGVHPSNPAFWLYSWLSEKIFLFSMFRDPYKSVSVLNLIYAIGIVYFFELIASKKRTLKIAITIFAILLLILSQSYLRGELFSKSELITIPQYIYDFANWNTSSMQIHNSKKLLLPSEPFPVLTLAKYPGKGSPLYFQILDSYSVQNTVTFTPYIKDIQNTLSSHEFGQIVGFYNIPYVVDLYDNYSPLYHTKDPKEISTILQPKMNKIISFGNGRIQIFQTPQKLVKSVVYIPSRIVAVTTFDPKKINLSTIFAKQKDNNFAFVDNKKITVLKQVPTLTITSQSNVRYNLQIKNIKNDFLLVFNENYSPSWVIKPPGAIFKTIPVKHIEVNGFTNGYVIDKDTLLKYLDKKNYTINPDGSINVHLELYFQPQLYFYIGLAITSLTLLVSLSFFLYSLNKKK